MNSNLIRFYTSTEYQTRGFANENFEYIYWLLECKGLKDTLHYMTRKTRNSRKVKYFIKYVALTHYCNHIICAFQTLVIWSSYQNYLFEKVFFKKIKNDFEKYFLKKNSLCIWPIHLRNDFFSLQ